MTELVTVKSHNRVADCICKSETRIDREQSSHVIGSGVEKQASLLTPLGFELTTFKLEG